MIDFLYSNLEITKVFYGLFLSFVCATIVLKTDRMFKLSDHQGLRYFRNAFFFYGLALIVGFVLRPYLINLMKFSFEFFLNVAGLFLLYSLVWRYLEKEISDNSLFNPTIIVFYIASFFLTFLDALFKTQVVLLVFQSVLFFILSILSYKNYREGDRKKLFSLSYFILILLGFFVWIFGLIGHFLNLGYISDIVFLVGALIFFSAFPYILKKMGEIKNEKKER